MSVSELVRSGAAAGRLVFAVTLSAAALGLVACGESEPSAPAESPRPEAGAKLEDRMAEFRSCMRENGLDLPEAPATAGPPPGIDQNDPEVQRAVRACRDLLPEGGPPGGLRQ
jgi:hypothetical protein